MVSSSGVLMLGVAGLAAAGAGVFGRGLFMPRSQIFGKVAFRGDQNQPARIALTFDDGPHPAVTPAILDWLGNHGVKAAFFIVGKHAAEHVDLVERIHGEGHIIGNHSYEHAHLGTMRGTSYWLREIGRSDDLIEQIIGKRPAMFRPPMGFKTHHLMRAARQRGHTVVTWTRRGYDGVRTTSEQIVARLRQPEAGDIVLLHDGAVAPFRVNVSATVQALDQLLRHWASCGLAVQRLDTLLGIPAYARPSKDSGRH